MTDLLSRETIANMYIKGEGIEIGALHAPVKVSESAKVRYVDRKTTPELKAMFPEVVEFGLLDVDIIDDGERLETIPDSTQDFVIMNHVIEHCQNTIGTIENMFRVLKKGGVLYMAIPDKRFTFDMERPITPVDHVIKDYDKGPACSLRHHYAEWSKFIEKVQDPAIIEKRVEILIEMDFNIHFHCWTQTEMLNLIISTRNIIDFDVEMFVQLGPEALFILRKN